MTNYSTFVDEDEVDVGAVDDVRDSKETRRAVWRNVIHLHQQLPSDCYELFLKKRYEVNADDELMMSIAENIKQIELDVPRTIGVSPSSLYNILYACVMCYPDVGYCQGMSYLAAMLLTVYDNEEDAFYTLVTMMNKYECRQLFKNTFPKLKQFTFVHEQLMRKRFAKLQKHLAKLSVNSSMYLPNWILSMFCHSFSSDFATDVFEGFLLHGWIAFHQIVLQLFACYEEQLLQCKCLESAMSIIQRDIPKTSFKQLERYEKDVNNKLESELNEAERLYKIKREMRKKKVQFSISQFRAPIY